MNVTPKRWLIWSLAAVLTAGVGAGGWWSYQRLKIRRADSLLNQSRSLAEEKGKLEEALNKAQAALQLNPANAAGRAWMAKLLARAGRAEALEYWQQSLDGRTPTAADRQALIELALQLRRLDIAQAQLAEALGQSEVPPAVFVLATKYCDATGDAAGAIRYGRVWHESRPTNPEAKFILGKHLLTTGNAQLEAQGKALLSEVAISDFRAARTALSLLASHPRLTEVEVRRLQGWLNSLPFSDSDRDFELVDLQLRLEPTREQELIDALSANPAQASNERLVHLGRWLARRGSFARVLQVIPKPRALADHDLFLICADALASLKRWEELDGWLQEKALPLKDALAELYRARVAGELKRDKQKVYHWAQAQWHASKEPAVLSYVARYAQTIGENQEAIKAYQQLAKEPGWTQEATLAVIKILQKEKQTRGLREFMRRLEQTYPADALPRNDRAYLDLLLEENVQEARQVATKLVQTQPQLLAYRSTLALACLRAGDFKGALEAYDGHQVDWSNVAPGSQAVFAAVLGKNGQTESAKKLATMIDRERLLPEETALVQPFF